MLQFDQRFHVFSEKIFVAKNDFYKQTKFELKMFFQEDLQLRKEKAKNSKEEKKKKSERLTIW